MQVLAYFHTYLYLSHMKSTTCRGMYSCVNAFCCYMCITLQSSVQSNLSEIVKAFANFHLNVLTQVTKGYIEVRKER